MLNKSVILISLVMCFSLTACSMSQSGALYQAQKSYQEADYETCLTKLSQADGYGEYSESVSSEIAFYRGLCLERADRKTEAVAVYQNLIRRYPKSNGAAQAQGRIASLNIIAMPSTGSGTNQVSNSHQTPSASTMLLLRVHVDSRYVSLPGSRSIPNDTAYDADVVLSKRYETVNTTDHLAILDLEKRRRIFVEKKTGTYVDYSLYDSIGLRVLELNNRTAMNQILAKANLDGQVLPGREDNEHTLSVQTHPPLVISIARDGGETVFSIGGKSLFQQSQKGMAVDIEDSTAFAQFLRYNFGGHPLILDDVAKGKLIPSKTTITFRNLFVNTVTITVTDIQRIAGTLYDLHGYAPRVLTQSQDGIDDILDHAWNMPVLRMDEAMDEEKQKLRREIATAFREARPFDAFLGVTEFALTTGEQLPVFSPNEKIMIESDAAFQKLLLALKPDTKERLQEAVKTLQELQQHARSKQDILKIFEANHRKALGETLTAQRLFTEVLRSHPLLTGAYKDLGDTLLLGYDTPRAWRCWDIGRRIVPQFGTLSSVDQFEKKLAADHPEYF